ncbi:MAG TPA: AraC family transcriptional regulator [Pyrinomonadaceae bacterium]|nr:AraC family transcriptional regulator [Pyrinomonadaceae bacterium]
MTVNDEHWKLNLRLLPHLDDLKLLHVADVTHYYPLHLHEELCIAVINRGTETHICRGNQYDAAPGQLLVLNPEEAHESRSIGVEYRAVQINPRTFARLWPEDFGDKPAPFFAGPVFKDVELFQSFSRLYSTLESPSSPLEQEVQLVSAIEQLLARLGNRKFVKAEPRAVRTVRDYLRAHYSENISLSNLASIADLSPFHLVRVFSNKIGVPPHEYQTQVRITHAQRIMRSGAAISEAAIETGFFDQSHFSRHFKRITGFTPRTYLRRHSNIVQDRLA